MSSEFPIQQADLCVKCGLCAPHCPTYALDRLEPEAPRGRIAIMTGLASGQIDDSPAAQSHLDHCLGCQACEAVCPANVPYLDLLDAHRREHPPQTGVPDRFVRSLVELDLLRPVLRLLLKALKPLRTPGMLLGHWLRRPSLTRLASLAPDHTAWRQPPRWPRPDLQLFVGCMGDLANAAAMQAFLRCCQALNLRVDVVPAQNCCGALAQHRGDQAASNKAQGRLQKTLRDDLPVVGLDSACVKQLRDSGWPQAQEVCAFLATQDWQTVPLRALDLQALIHQPCSHRNGLGETDAARTLLQHIPALQLKDTRDALCCGAAGLHMLDFPQRADALLAPKLEDSRKADVVLTTNVGCATHFAAGLRRERLQQKERSPMVCHPVELLVRALHD